MLASEVKVSAHPVEELYEELLVDERTFILDVRNEEDFAQRHAGRAIERVAQLGVEMSSLAHSVS